MTLTIDPEFAGKIPPLTEDEYRLLEENILRDGKIISPLITWNGIIVDGHNRYRILQEHPELPYETEEMEFPDRYSVIAWICSHQLGQRNLTEAQKKYLRGKQYEAEKAIHGHIAGTKLARDQNGRFTVSCQTDNNGECERTVDRIARENNTSSSSIIRSEKYAKGVEAADEVIPGIKDEILSERLKCTDKDIIAVARASPDEREALARKLKEPGDDPQILVPVLSCSEYEEDVEDDDFSEEDDFPAFEPKKTKAQELREIQAISESMLHASGGDTIEDVLYELNDALESMIFRWNFCFETHEAIYRKKDNLKRIRLLAKEGINYLKTIGGKQVHENQ